MPDTPPKVRQSAFWTCGLACVAMALGWTDDARLRAHHERAAGGPTVPWTVELLRYLVEFLPADQSARMTTTSPGVAAAATGAEFYAGMGAIELRRVADLYQAEARGIRTVPATNLADAAAARCCIFLVDDRYLRGACRRCGPATRPPGELDPAQYVGHYVLVTRIGDSEVRYLDPGRDHAQGHPRHCVVPLRRFEQAHRAPGTDQDCIVIQTESK